MVISVYSRVFCVISLMKYLQCLSVHWIMGATDNGNSSLQFISALIDLT